MTLIDALMNNWKREGRRGNPLGMYMIFFNQQLYQSLA